MGERDGAGLALGAEERRGWQSPNPKPHRIHGLKMFPQRCCIPWSLSRVWGMALPIPIPGSSRGASSAGGSALPGPVVSREMLTPLTRCQNTNTQPDSLKSNYEGAAEPGLAFDSEESCKRHQGRSPAPAQRGPGTFLTGNNPVCLLKCGHLSKFRGFFGLFYWIFPFLTCHTWM